MAKDELFDDELCSMVKFTDTQKQQTPTKVPATSAVPVAKKPKPVESEGVASAEFEPVQPKNVEPLKECAKRVLPLGAMSLLVFYWQQSGQMMSSASMPCIYVFAILAGIAIGKLIGSVNK